MRVPKPVLLMTRPSAASERFLAQLPPALAGLVCVCVSPLLEITPVRGLEYPAGMGGIILSSANAVAMSAATPQLKELPAYCIGEATTEAAKQFGWNASFAGQDADALVEHLTTGRPNTPLLHLRGTHTRGEIAERLSGVGLPTRSLIVYNQRLIPLSHEAQNLLDGTGPIIAPLFSPRTARHFAQQRYVPSNCHFVVISQAVADGLEKGKEFGSVTVAKHPDAPGMIQAIQESLDYISRVETRRVAQ